VLVGRRPALTRDFAIMLDDLRSALQRLDQQPRNLVKNPVSRPPKASSNEIDTGSRHENASKRDPSASRNPN
jgi:ribonuclease P protein component